VIKGEVQKLKAAIAENFIADVGTVCARAALKRLESISWPIKSCEYAAA
jgi:hypothetical protein